MEGELIRCFGKAKGRVQGVGFRFFVQQNAIELGLTGWVRNMDDGTVTMEIQGRQDKINALEQRIRKGNYFIKVKDIQLQGRETVIGEKRFDISY